MGDVPRPIFVPGGITRSFCFYSNSVSTAAGDQGPELSISPGRSGPSLLRPEARGCPLTNCEGLGRER